VPRVRRFAPRTDQCYPAGSSSTSASAKAPDLLGHADVGTTMIYAHVLGRGPGGVPGRLDRLAPASP